MSKLVTAVLLLVTVLGVGCLNYTKAFGIEHHYEMAAESGLPAPSGPIYFLGLFLTTVGAGCLGYRLGRRREG